MFDLCRRKEHSSGGYWRVRPHIKGSFTIHFMYFCIDPVIVGQIVTILYVYTLQNVQTILLTKGVTFRVEILIFNVGCLMPAKGNHSHFPIDQPNSPKVMICKMKIHLKVFSDILIQAKITHLLTRILHQNN